MTQREVHIGTSTLQNLGQNFVVAWKKAEQGQLKEITHENIYFTN